VLPDAALGLNLDDHLALGSAVGELADRVRGLLEGLVR